MHETEHVSNETRAGERAATGNTATIGRVLDITVIAFVIVTLVLMPILVGGAHTGQTQDDDGSFSVQERDALAESRGDAAASAVAENDASANAANGTDGAAQRVSGTDGEPVDQETHDAIEEASRGDAAARGSVASDYNEAGGSH